MPELRVCWDPGISVVAFEMVVGGLFKAPWVRSITREGLVISAEWRAIPSLERAVQMSDAIVVASGDVGGPAAPQPGHHGACVRPGGVCVCGLDDV